MSSLMTNSAAMTALQTLKATNKALDTTQGRISTGFRVAEAADNAAYWSIATTMRSDNKAMSTVQDALGLGAAQVDVAYTAMDAVKDSLDEIKAKLVAASQPNIDKAKIQEEIKQLQNDLRTYAKSATFSGGNWLDVNEHSIQKVVASFIREESGAITLGTIDIDTRKVALFTGDNTGLLQGAVNLTVGGEAPDVSALSGTASVADAGEEDITFAGFTALEWAAGDTVTFNIDIAGTDVAVSGTFDGTDWTFEHTDPANYTITFDTSGNDLVVNVANAGGADPSAVTIDGFQSIRGEASTGTPIDLSAVTGPTGATVADTEDDDFTFTGFGGIAWEAGDTVSFTIDVDGTDVAVAGSFDGTNWTFDHDDPAGATITFDASGGDLVVNIANASGGGLAITFGDISGSRAGEGINVTNFDITNLDRDQIELLINHVDGVLSRVTTAASDLGAIKSRVGMQASFVSNLMDAVNRGIGQLVDADMTEESTRLQALQVQQQLGIQALTIANGNSQVILALFRG